MGESIHLTAPTQTKLNQSVLFISMRQMDASQQESVGGSRNIEILRSEIFSLGDEMCTTSINHGRKKRRNISDELLTLQILVGFIFLSEK